MGQLSESTSLTSELEKQIEKLNLKNVQSEETINLITNEKQNLERELERSSLEMNISNERNAEMKATIDNLKVTLFNYNNFNNQNVCIQSYFQTGSSY